MWQRLSQNWVYGALPLAIVLFLLVPLIEGTMTSVYLSLPVYMLHQYEEHDADRFRVAVNEMLGAERKGLDHNAVWVINVVFVWFLLTALFLLCQRAPAWGLVAGYLMLITAAVHIIAAARTKTYNPGLITSILFFVPLSLWIFASVSGSLPEHLASATLIIGLHAGIVLWAMRKEAP